MRTVTLVRENAGRRCRGKTRRSYDVTAWSVEKVERIIRSLEAMGYTVTIRFD